MRKLLCVVAGLTAAIAASRAEPPAPITAEQEFLAEQIATLEEESKSGNPVPARPLSQIVRLDLVDGLLQFKLVANDVGDDATIPLKGVRGVCRVQRLGDNLPFPDAMRLSVHALDIEHAKAIQIEIANIGRLQMDVTVSTPKVSITTQLMTPMAGGIVLEDAEPRFHVQVINETSSESAPSIQRTAASVSRLIDENHDQLLESIGEAMRLMHAAHLLSGMNDLEVKRMLAANTAPDAEVQRAVAEVIHLMQSDPEAAEGQLRKLLDSHGLAAATALARLPRDNWSADVTMRVDNALAPMLAQNSDAPDKVNGQPHRLVDLLYWPDPAIRAAALDRIKSLTSTLIPLDTVRDPYTQADQIEELRARFP